jgi:class 3 adenylate cyclase
VIEQEVQSKITISVQLLDEARTFYKASNYDESEQCANTVLELLEPYADRKDLGEEFDTTSLKYAIIDHIAHAYSRLNSISLTCSKHLSALQYAQTAISYCERIKNLHRIAGLFGNIGIVYKNLSEYQRALEYMQKALERYEMLDAKEGIANTLSSIGSVYWQLSEYSRAVEYHQKALVINQYLGRKSGIANNLGNIGRVYNSLSDYPRALEYQRKALALNEEIGSKPDIAVNLASIGIVYGNLSDYSRVLEFYHKALAINQEIGNKFGIASNFGSIGELYAHDDYDGYDLSKAEEYLLKSMEVSEEIGAKRNLYQCYKLLSAVYREQKRWEEADSHFQLFYELEKQVQSEEAKKQADKLDYERQTAEREKLLAIERTRAQSTEELLHKTLPKSIANRVIQGETRIADYFENTSILFADMVGFTKISTTMPPASILGFMNFIFEHFDTLAEKYGCERIKTIGDGYMAVCGAPIPYDNHAERLAHMAIDMLKGINLPDEIQSYLPEGMVFRLRLGLHSGEITAGLIGTGKLAYDIYGDAVNTASRMESHGEAGRIHVSEDFRNSAGNEFTFIERGEMDIKGKGKMKTYFLEL